MKKDSSLGFTSKARKIHGDKYDYSKVVYSTNCEKVCITCPKHGDFWQTPNHHLRGCGCPICTSEERRESEKKSFIDKASKIHDGKYDYFNVNYINNHTNDIFLTFYEAFFYTFSHFMIFLNKSILPSLK